MPQTYVYEYIELCMNDSCYGIFYWRLILARTFVRHIEVYVHLLFSGNNKEPVKKKLYKGRLGNLDQM